MRRAVLSLLVGAVTVSVTSRGEAGEKVRRLPLKPALLEGTRPPIERAQLRQSEVTLAQYHSVAKIVRERTEDKSFATFYADPLLIEPGAAMLFEIRSIAASGEVLRWRCLARIDVAECLGAPVRIRYLPDDDRVVLTATLKPESEISDHDSTGLASR